MIEEQKEHYDTAKELVSVIKVLIQPEDIVKQYLDAADEMKLAGDYKDAQELEKLYCQKAEKAETEGKEMLYQKAKKRMEEAEKDVHLMLAKQTFARVKGYKDSDRLMEECDHLIAKMEKKTKTKSLGMTLAVVVIAAALIFAAVRDGEKTPMETLEETTQETIIKK